MKEELISGIENAIERGFSLEEAVQSFVNAGYNQIEVQQAAHDVSEGASTIVQGTPDSANSSPKKLSSLTHANQNLNPSGAVKTNINPSNQTAQVPKMQQQTMSLPTMPQQKSHKTLIIVLIVILLGLILGVIGAVFFGNQLFQLISKLHIWN